MTPLAESKPGGHADCCKVLAGAAAGRDQGQRRIEGVASRQAARGGGRACGARGIARFAHRADG